MDLAGAVALDARDPELYALREAGKRMSDALNAKVVFGAVANFGRWMAFALEDGSSNGDVYDTREDALRHQPHAQWAWFEQLRPAGYSVDECALTLAYARAAYESGWRPDQQYPTPIMPVRIEDGIRKIKQLRHHGRRR